MIKDINAITPEYMKHRIEEETQQYKQEIERLKELSKVDSQQAQEIIIELKQEIERLNKENEELKHKLKLINSYVYGCNIDSLGSDTE